MLKVRAEGFFIVLMTARCFLFRYVFPLSVGMRLIFVVRKSLYFYYDKIV